MIVSLLTSVFFSYIFNYDIIEDTKALAELIISWFNNINNAKTAKEKAMYEEKRNFTKKHIKKWTILKSKALENQK